MSITGVLGGMASQAGQGLMNRASAKIGDKVFGSPGEEAKDYMDEAYPGTTPWERLGGGGGGSQAASAATNQKMSIEGQKDIAKIHAKSAENVATINNPVNKIKRDAADTAMDFLSWGKNNISNHLKNKNSIKSIESKPPRAVVTKKRPKEKSKKWDYIDVTKKRPKEKSKKWDYIDISNR